MEISEAWEELEGVNTPSSLPSYYCSFAHDSHWPNLPEVRGEVSLTDT